jgi:hypothetical protein
MVRWPGARRRVLSFVAITLVLGCDDGRPEVDEAKAWFENRYPEASISDVRISEDEVVARSFRFQYRSREGRDGEVEVQFMQDTAEAWVPTPPVPAQLP